MSTLDHAVQPKGFTVYHDDGSESSVKRRVGGCVLFHQPLMGHGRGANFTELDLEVSNDQMPRAKMLNHCFTEHRWEYRYLMSTYVGLSDHTAVLLLPDIDTYATVVHSH